MTLLDKSKFEYPRVDLTDDEVEYPIKVGEKRSNSKERETEIRKEIKGAIAEYMVSKYYDVRFDDRIYRTGDDGSDLIIHEKRVDVKSDNTANPRLFVSEDFVHADIFILVWLPPQDEFPPQRGFILGCASRETVEASRVWEEEGGERNYILDWDSLKEVPEP